MSRRFLTPSKIPRYLICIICSEVFKNPARLDCAHTFCRQCISKWLKEQKSCPVCRNPSNGRSLANDHIANYATEDLEVVCTNNGCIWTGKLKDSKAHEKRCKFHPDRLDPWIANKIPLQELGEDEDLERPESNLLCNLYEKYGGAVKSIFQAAKPDLNVQSLTFSDSDEESSVNK